MTEQLKTIELTTAIKRGDKEIKTVEVTKPNVRALKGLKMVDVLYIDVDAFLTLLPRVTQPVLTKADLENLDPSDFTQLCTEVVSFLGKTETAGA